MTSLRSTVAVCALVTLAGCQTLSLNNTPTRTDNQFVVNSGVEADAVSELVHASNLALEARKMDEASRLINLALKLDVTNPDLQFLNGLTYHLMGVQGDASKFDLAEQGYKQALKFDPGNLSASYQLGLLYMDQRRYGLAQAYFAAVALHRGDDPAVLYSLASASYYARDPLTAEAALKRLMDVAPEAKQQPEVLKAAALSLAAMDDRTGASAFLAAYRKAVLGPENIEYLERRVQGWQSFYDSDAKVMLAQYGNDPYGSTDPYGSANPYGAQDPYGSSNPYGAAAAPDPYAAQQQDPYGAANPAQQGFADTGMVVVDVVLIGTQEDVRNSRGINLLNGLQLQFGDPLSGTSGFGYESTRTKDYLNTGLEQSTQTITRAISIPAVTYSLNIANSADADNQVLAKPSLVAQTGQTSEFFSGTEILAAAVSGGNGDSVSVQKEVGVKLAVTPEILPDDMIRLHVVAERTFLTDPSNSVVFEFRLDTTKTNVNSTVTMKFGETLVLGGLSERETSKSADGVPGLMDIPIVNLLFSQRIERQFERSVLILMTPRRPLYARRAQEDRDVMIEEMSDLERDIERLENRHKDWFTPRATFSEVIEKLQGREFFEEFRNGDVKIQSWQNDENGQQHIAMVRDRLLGL
ncbi:type II and III secretion system protein [Thalassospira profundimaris]|uniref:type II and III secretion system protein n=2 Tax=Thalassospira TaxID=168934 RepID=UPI0005947E80|nr:type II and III secretion system protein [Thalassospira profundimaris]